MSERLACARNVDFKVAPLRTWDDYAAADARTDLLVLPGHENSPYQVGCAVSRRCIEQALRLRYEVFNLELGEGLETSHHSGLDEDRFDAQMVHLVLWERRTREVVGTYRLQTMVQAAGAAEGSYSGQEFDLAPLAPLFDVAAECGRACLAASHRNLRALTQLWLGLGAFMNFHRQRYLFGCCSLRTIQPADGWAAWRFLEAGGHLHPAYRLKSRPVFQCGEPPRVRETLAVEAYPLPKLFKIYLKLGATVLSEPALDRDFGTIDFLVLIDARQVTLSSLGVVA